MEPTGLDRGADARSTLFAQMCYPGQNFDMSVPVPEGDAARRGRPARSRRALPRPARARAWASASATSSRWSAACGFVARGTTPKPDRFAELGTGHRRRARPARATGPRTSASSSSTPRSTTAPRSARAPTIDGPALIEEPFTVVVVPPGATVHARRPRQLRAHARLSSISGPVSPCSRIRLPFPAVGATIAPSVTDAGAPGPAWVSLPAGSESEALDYFLESLDHTSSTSHWRSSRPSAVRAPPATTSGTCSTTTPRSSAAPTTRDRVRRSSLGADRVEVLRVDAVAEYRPSAVDAANDGHASPVDHPGSCDRGS